MTMFWIAASTLTVVVLAVMLRPLLRRPDETAGPERLAFDMAVYKDQQLEIDRDLDRGVLNADQATAARTEIERRMLVAEKDGQDAVQTKRTRAPAWMIGAVVALVPLGAFGLYSVVGNPTMPDEPYVERTQDIAKAGDSENRKIQLEKMVTSIEAQLKKDPTQPRSWALLGQANQMLGDNVAAVKAFQQLVKVTDGHPDALMVLAEAIFVEAGDVVTPAAVKLFKKAKSLAPTNPMTYYYLGMERQVADDAQGAMDEFAGLLSISPSDGKWVPNIKARMRMIAAKSGIEMPVVQLLPPLATATASASSAAPSSQPGPTQQQVKDAQNMSSVDQQAMIRSMVQRLADRLKNEPDDLEGWKRLAKAYGVLGEAVKVKDAQAQIKRLENR